MYILECKNLSKEFGNKKVLKNINLKIQKNKVVGLLGPNGSGKTTLIKLITGLLYKTNGEIKINGDKFNYESTKFISYLPDKSFLDENSKVKEILEFYKTFYEDFNLDKAKELLNKLEIDENDKLKTLSKGTKEKISLIMCVSRKALLYILDEPIGGVDPASRDYILDTILNNFNENASIIISTHLISDVEKILDDVIFIKNGEIVLFEDADKIRKEKNTSIDNLFREEFKC